MAILFLVKQITGDTSAQSAIKKAMDDVNKKIAKGNTSSSAKKERVKIDEEGEREIQTAVSSQRAEEEKEDNETNNAKETNKEAEEGNIRMMKI